VLDDPFADEVRTKMKIGTASRFPNNTLTMVADTETMRYEYDLTITSTDAAQVDHATSIEFFPPEHTYPSKSRVFLKITEKLKKLF